MFYNKVLHIYSSIQGHDVRHISNESIELIPCFTQSPRKGPFTCKLYHYKCPPVFALRIYRLLNFRSTVGLVVSALFVFVSLHLSGSAAFFFFLVRGKKESER